jgi:signal transduction histidine kinase
MHDQEGQALTAIKIDVARAEQGLLPSQTDLIERLRRARKAEETLEIIRRLSMLLRPSMLDDLGLSAALGWYTKQFSASDCVTSTTMAAPTFFPTPRDQLVQDRPGSPHQLPGTPRRDRF